MTFIQLTYFKAVYDLGSINKAAQHLHVSAPAISVSVRKLEQEYGIHLFLHPGSRMVPTEEGRLFYKEVVGLLQDFDRLSAVAKDIAKTPHTIRYGTVPLAGSYLTPLILHNFHNLYPNENIVSQENTPESLADKVLSGELDVILVPKSRFSSYDLQNEKLEHMMVKSQGFYFATYPQHPLAYQKAISVRSIVDEPLVLLHGNYSQNKMINEMYNSIGIAPNVIYRTGQLKTIERFVTRGIASSFMYQGLIEETAGLVGIPVDEIAERVNLNLIWRNSGYMFSSVKKFIRSVKLLISDIS